MVDRRIWFDRVFELGLPVEAFPDILERVRGTPARLEELLAGVDAAARVARPGNRWSIQENVGHLLDLEPLWAGRLDDLLGGVAELRPADLENRKTREANHNAAESGALLAAFRIARTDVVNRLESTAAADMAREALHPRLKQPMRIVDLFFFVAEHDDHHLARITELLRQRG